MPGCIASIGNASLIAPRPDHYAQCWDLVCRHPWSMREGYFAGTQPNSAEDFERWIYQHAMLPVVCVAAGRVVGGGYLDQVETGYFGSVCVFKDREFRDYGRVRSLMWAGLAWYCETLNLCKLVAIMRSRHIPCRILVRELGFTHDGRLRRHRRVNGQWEDYEMWTLLREELEQLREAY